MPLAQALAEALTVYTSMPKRFAVETVNAFEKQNPGTEVSLFRSGTGNVLSKLRAEATAGAVQADVVMIADEITMEALKRDNRLEAWRDAPVQRMPKGSYDPDMTYFGTKVMSTVLAYNTKLARRPASWKDVLGGDNAGQVVMANAVTSGAALASLSYLTGASGLGWKYFEDLARNKTLVVRANGEVRDMVAKGSRKYGIMLDYMVVAAKKKGSPIDFVYPAEGVVATYQPVAILKGAKNRATARKFVAYLLSPEGQARVVEQGYRPLYPDIKPPAGYPASGEVRIVPVAAEDSVTNAETMKKRFDALFRG
jgi:iron(III) transport system substrate-binding protein